MGFTCGNNGLVFGGGKVGHRGFWVFWGRVFLDGLMRILHVICVVGERVI